MFGMVPFNFRNSPARNKDSWDRCWNRFFEQPLNPLQKVSAAFSSVRVDVKDNGDSYGVAESRAARLFQRGDFGNLS